MRKLPVQALISAAMVLVLTPAVDAQIDYSRIDIRTGRDIAVNTLGALWTVGSDPAAPAGIQRLVASALVTQPGTAVRIAVDPNGNAWVVNETGDLYHWEKTGAAPEAWVKSDLKAMDIGVGRSGAVWAVGVDHRIMKLDKGTWNAISGAGDRIAVDNSGNPWVVNSGHNIWHWNGTAWEAIPGKAQDVAVAPDATVFIVGEAQKPGGFQILRRSGNEWVEIPGAAGIAVAATRTTLSVAQLPGSQVVAVNVPVYTQPATKVDINVPVITQPTTIAIQTQPGNSIPVAGPVTSLASTTALPPTPAGSKVRNLFWRDQTDEARMLQAIRYDKWGDRIFLNGQYPPASSLSTLERAFAHMAMFATEAYYNDQPQILPGDVLAQIGNTTNPNTRRRINTILATMLIGKMYDRSTDAETVALRDWATQMWRAHMIVAAKSTLDEYRKWKQDPCGYEGKQAGECKTMSELFTTRTPPENLFASKALNAMFAKNGSEIAATAGVIAGSVGGTVSAAVLASQLGLEAVAADFVANTPAVFTSLLNTFGGMTANSAGAISTAGMASAGGAVFAAGLMIVVVGTSEGFKVVNAMRVEPMLTAQLGRAMSHPLVIENELNSDAAKEFFLLDFQNVAANRFVLPVNTVDGEVRYYNQGGYVARMIASWRRNGKFEADTSASISVGGEKTFVIPASATGINLQTDWSDLGITWRKFWSTPLPAPTYIGYTSYGTVFSPQVKEGYPEVENIKGTQNTLTLTHGGGYVARIRVVWTQAGKSVVKFNNIDASAGWRQEIAIPADATNIYVEIFSRTGWIGEPLKAAFVKTWPSPPNECVKIYGTTLDPKWNSECR